jgi:polyisoprenyl-phosphate glycosyltransferase
MKPLDYGSNMSAHPTLWILCPCYYASVIELTKRAQRTLEQNFPQYFQIRFVPIDDSGGQDTEFRTQVTFPMSMTVPYNLGHQGALVYALRQMSGVIEDFDYVVTLDADGEDRPEDLPALLAPLMRQPDELSLVALAARTKRQESPVFKLCYLVFKSIFQLLTGSTVKNGNFAAYRGWTVRHLLFHPFFDYCYSSSLLALAPNRRNVPLPRGNRYFGKTKMTWTSLIAHGFRMMLPFSERIAVRGIILSPFLFACGALSAISTVALPANLSAFAMAAAFLFFSAGLLGLATAGIFFQVVNQTKALTIRNVSISGITRDPFCETVQSSDVVSAKFLRD